MWWLYGWASVSFGHIVRENLLSGRNFKGKITQITVFVQGKTCTVIPPNWAGTDPLSIAQVLGQYANQWTEWVQKTLKTKFCLSFNLNSKAKFQHSIPKPYVWLSVKSAYLLLRRILTVLNNIFVAKIYFHLLQEFKLGTSLSLNKNCCVSFNNLIETKIS